MGDVGAKVQHPFRLWLIAASILTIVMIVALSSGDDGCHEAQMAYMDRFAEQQAAHGLTHDQMIYAVRSSQLLAHEVGRANALCN